MENLKDPEVQAWMKAQSDYTRTVLATIPGRLKLLARIRELDQSAPAQVSNVQRLPGDLYFYQKLIAGQDVSKLYMRRGLEGDEVLLIDPEKVHLTGPGKGKGKNAIVYFAPSQHGKYVAVGIAPGGSENDTELHVVETMFQRETGDVVLRALEPDATWLPDDRSLVHGRLQKLPPGAPETELRQKYRSYLHVLGTDAEKDRPVFGYGVVASIDVDPHYFSSLV